LVLTRSGLVDQPTRAQLGRVQTRPTPDSTPLSHPLARAHARTRPPPRFHSVRAMTPPLLLCSLLRRSPATFGVASSRRSSAILPSPGFPSPRRPVANMRVPARIPAPPCRHFVLAGSGHLWCWPGIDLLRLASLYPSPWSI
jgi:hypothetical protein